eukprot:gb/GEZN01012099.1/.p1 GENE.gb/GEZN01012099.1/~~gb/GEZN01012099.1/.p1  ORF type:complete len:353 (+),score=39.11 gb/GEZN01012099.1/:35-1060(+)
MFELFGQGFHAPESFCEFYTCFPVAFAPKATTQTLDVGDKILLPASALKHLAVLKVTYPMMFEVTNPRTSVITHVGVREFSAEEGKCYFPYWIMENLKVKNGGMVRIKNVSLPKGQYVKFQPHSVKFTELSNPRVVLERALRNYSCLTQGDTIIINHGGIKYPVDIKEVRPGSAVSVIETDVNVDFAPPLDMPKEPERKSAPDPGPDKDIGPKPGQVKVSSAAVPELKANTAKTEEKGGYFAKLGGGLSLVGTSSSSSSSTLSTSSSSSSASSSISSAQPAPTAGGSPGGSTYSKVQGKFTYIYSKEGKLLRRIVTPSAPRDGGSAVPSFKPFAGDGHSLR